MVSFKIIKLVDDNIFFILKTDIRYCYSKNCIILFFKQIKFNKPHFYFVLHIIQVIWIDKPGN
ncbi:hypothetical protein PFFCH_04455 [Plasmodium falciparum FCH/4]|uniref:Uncharacterized protein n=1 Tax=Plasmodium falciparum FCH/4 TaxID=1036724 RepID=A0A024VHA9_PLAFA|nr:hypothetical protein PFFCH_04455 [Plasmodium falciparum FCH/4]